MIKKFFIKVFFLVPIFAQGLYLNKSFPKIEGISLSGNDVKFPDIVFGKPTVLAVALGKKRKNVLIHGL